MRYPSSVNSSRLYHRYFSSLGGVDVSSDPSEVSLGRFADMRNMWRDPKAKEGNVTETFPGYYGIHLFDGPIHAVFRQRSYVEDYLIVHAGERLYRFHEGLRHHPHLVAAWPPLEVTVPSQKGTSFTLGMDIYLLIGGTCLRIDADGVVHLFDSEGCAPYVPTTYLGGEPYEQRNLLTDKVKHVFSVSEHTYRGEDEVGLSYVIVSEEEGLCSVKASRNLSAASVTVPATTRIGGKEYKVVGVEPYGFAALSGLIRLSLPDTLYSIGEGAFSANEMLRTAVIPDSVTAVGPAAFYGCSVLSTLYMGKGVSTVGSSAFSDCPLETVYFGADAETAGAIVTDGTALFDTDPTLFYEKAAPEDRAALFRFPIPEPFLTLDGVAIGDTALSASFTYGGASGRYKLSTEGGVRFFTLYVSDSRAIEGERLTLAFTAEGGRFTALPHHTPFTAESVNGREAVFGCTAVAAFDGRLFFTGHPLLPNTVFYSAPDDTGYNNPFYVGVLNYFNDGVGGTPNRALLPLGDRLAVIKEAVMGEGEIFLHAPLTTGEDLLPRIYPVSSGLTGLGIYGDPITFGGEHLLLTEKGLMALSPTVEEGRYTLSPRSTAVNRRLCKENLASVSMAVHEGVLYLLAAGQIYLAYDTGEKEYEWFLLSGIGYYDGGAPVVRYSGRLPEEAKPFFDSIAVHERVGEVTSSPLYSVAIDDETLFYYVTENGVSYPVDSEGEYEGGTFYPATMLIAAECALYFATPEGGFGSFHTDKRGMAAYFTRPSALYIQYEGAYRQLSYASLRPVGEEAVRNRRLYKKTDDGYLFVKMGDVYVDSASCIALAIRATGEVTETGIHPLFYTFDGRRYPSYLLLASDDGGLPHYRKDTQARSATVKLKAFAGEAPSVLVRTDRHPFRLCDRVGAGVFDFAYTDFTALDFHGDDFATLSLREKERGWTYKQYLFSSEGFRAPFGVYSLTYSYYTAGRPKP